MQKGVAPLKIILLIVIGVLVLRFPYYVPWKPCVIPEGCQSGWGFTQPLGFTLGQKILYEIQHIIKTDVVIKRTPLPSPSFDNQVCVQVITPARNPKTGECREFGTPCDVLRDWVRVGSCSLGEDGCVKNLQFTYKEGSYKKGQIRIYFKPDVDESLAKLILNDYGLDFRQRFSSSISIGGIVSVEVGKEFEMVCKLKQNKNIAFVEPSVIIKIPDCTKGPC